MVDHLGVPAAAGNGRLTDVSSRSKDWNMISLTRLNGQVFALNGDLIERVDDGPDTVITLVDGTTYVVAETIDEVMQRVVEMRAAVVARSQAPAPTAARPTARDLRIVPDLERW